MIATGRLRQRIAIERPPTDQDDVGQPLGPWVPVATVWADIRHVSGIETVKSGADTSIVRASIRIRIRGDLDAGMRAVHGAAIYDIKALLPSPAAGYIDLVCESVS